MPAAKKEQEVLTSNTPNMAVNLQILQYVRIEANVAAILVTLKIAVSALSDGEYIFAKLFLLNSFIFSWQKAGMILGWKDFPYCHTWQRRFCFTHPVSQFPFLWNGTD